MDLRVLLCFPMQDNQTGLYIYKAFKSLGCEMSIVDAKLEPQRLFQEYEQFAPDLIFCSRTKELLPQIKLIREDKLDTCIMTYNVDKRDSVKEFGPELLELFNLSDIFFTIARGNIGEYKSLCPNTEVYHLQQGCDPEVHNNLDVLTEEDHNKYDCDVLFAGSYKSYAHHGRRELIDYLLSHSNLKIKLFGLKGDKIVDSEHNKACRCAKICLGHNGWPTIALSMSVRVYKIMAAGGFLLEEYCDGIDQWFDNIKEFPIDVYDSKESCLKLINYWIDNDYRRNIKAEIGRRLVTEDHTYLHRIETVLSYYYIWKEK